MIDPFQLTATSNNGLLFLKLVLGMQDLWSTYEKANKEQRVEAAALLRRIATCVKDIHHEISSDEPNPSKHAGSMVSINAGIDQAAFATSASCSAALIMS